MNKFWLVWKKEGGHPKHKHNLQVHALNEAQRLAQMNPGKEFYVLEATMKVVTNNTHVEALTPVEGACLDSPW